MKKIMVIGVSAGVGKSTFARKLSKKLQIDVHHLDILAPQLERINRREILSPSTRHYKTT